MPEKENETNLTKIEKDFSTGYLCLDKITFLLLFNAMALGHNSTAQLLLMQVHTLIISTTRCV